MRDPGRKGPRQRQDRQHGDAEPPPIRTPRTTGAEPSGRPDDLTIDDFVIDAQTEQVTCCPDGHAPVRSVHHPASGRTHTMMPAGACGPCAFRHQCPVQERQNGYHLEHTAKQRRMAARRREQETDVFRERYRRRSGIESTNSGLKRRTGLGRLRVRGRPRVFPALYLKVAGWNILRASVCAKMREWVRAKAQAAVLGATAGLRTVSDACRKAFQGLPTVISAFPYPLLPGRNLRQAA